MVTETEREGAVYVLPATGEGYEEILSEDEKEFRTFKEEMGDASSYAKILVARKPIDQYGNVQGRNTFQLFECGLTDYTFSQLFSRIRDQHGTGLYQIQGRDKEGKIRFNKTIGIEAPKDPDAEKNPDSIAAVMSHFRQAMAEQQQRTEQMMRSFQPQTQGGSMLEMMTGMAMLMKELRPDTQTAIPPKTMIETLTELKLTKDLVGDLMGGAEGSGQIDNFWGAIAKTVESFGGPLLNVISLAQQQGKINADGVIQPPVLPAPEPETKPAEAAPGRPTDINAMNLKEMREQLEFLLIQAKNNVQYAIVVDFIIDQMPDEDSAYDAFEQFLQDENCIDRCAMILPEINKHRDWFIEWRTAMLEKLDALIEPDAAPDLMSDYPQKEDLSSIKNDDSKEQSSLTSEPEKPDDAATPAPPDDAGDALTDSGHDATTGKDRDPLDVDGDSKRDGGDLRDS